MNIVSAYPIGRLRHHPRRHALAAGLEPLPARPLPPAFQTSHLALLDGEPLLVGAAAILPLAGLAEGAGPIPDAAVIALPPGWAQSSVSGPPLWLTADRRVLDFGLHGAGAVRATGADGALGLDDTSLLVWRKGLFGWRVSLEASGRSRWKAAGGILGACPGDEVIAVAEAHSFQGYDRRTGERRFLTDAALQGVRKIIGFVGSRLWVAGAERHVVALRPDDGARLHAVDTGIASPSGALDPEGCLQIATSVGWVSVDLAAEAPRVVRRVKLSPAEVGRIAPDPIPLDGDRLLMRSRDTVWLVRPEGCEALYRSRTGVLDVVVAGGGAYILLGDVQPTALVLLRPARGGLPLAPSSASRR